MIPAQIMCFANTRRVVSTSQYNSKIKERGIIRKVTMTVVAVKSAHGW